MNLDELNSLVTEKIRRAEILDDLGAPGAVAAYRDVSFLEERITVLLPHSNTEGAIARRGAVRAAVAANDLERAKVLIARFSKEDGATDALKQQLDTIVEESSASSQTKVARPSHLSDRILKNIAYVRNNPSHLLSVIAELERDLLILRETEPTALALALKVFARSVGPQAISSALPGLVSRQQGRMKWIADALIGGAEAPMEIISGQSGCILVGDTSTSYIESVPRDLSQSERRNWLIFLATKAPRSGDDASAAKSGILKELESILYS